jgi:hypothetical protein
MDGNGEQETTALVHPVSTSMEHSGLTRTDVIRRTTAPVTANGSRWEVQLSAPPPPEWLQFFKQSGVASASSMTALRPQRVTFDRTSVVFNSEADHVERWIEAIDKWIAWTEARYVLSLDEASRQRTIRLDDEARQRERIQQLNDRFKNL